MGACHHRAVFCAVLSSLRTIVQRQGRCYPHDTGDGMVDSCVLYEKSGQAALCLRSSSPHGDPAPTNEPFGPRRSGTTTAFLFVGPTSASHRPTTADHHGEGADRRQLVGWQSQARADRPGHLRGRDAGQGPCSRCAVVPQPDCGSECRMV